MTTNLSLQKSANAFHVSFKAMASTCELIIQTTNHTVAKDIFDIVYHEAKRIEKKYSRYRDDNIIYQIHQHQPVQLDEETINMLRFAELAYNMSDGLFDITSGVLRKLWCFNGKATPPSKKQVLKVLPYIGWKKIEINWQTKSIKLPLGMQIDFGGFGKEYAVDYVVDKIAKKHNVPVLVNFGGDIAVTQKPNDKEYWLVGIESQKTSASPQLFKLISGAIATSGNSNQYIMVNGKKSTHILNPITGFPVSYAPSSISVVMPSCLQAGFICTLATLQGKQADKFLKSQGVVYFMQR